MKFIHIADVHLGATPEAESGWPLQRGKEIFDTFCQVVTFCEKEQIDLLIIAGDLFHHQPLLRELKEVNYILGRLTHTKVVLIAGNHDYIAARSNYIDFPWNENTFFLFREEMDSIYLEELNTEVYGFSYHTRDITETRYQNVFCTVEERINILVAHGGDERNIPIDLKNLEKTGFDYIALGHIHKPHIFSDKMAYSGSLEPLDKTEIGEHGFIQGIIEKSDNNTSCQIALIPFSKRKYCNLFITATITDTNYSILERIKQEIQENGEDNMYRVNLTGYRDPNIQIDIEEIKQLGYVTEVKNMILPNYDFDRLYEENKNNLIGAYIKRIRNSSEDETITQKALYYGIEALLNTKER